MKFNFTHYLPEAVLACVDEVIREEVAPYVKTISVLPNGTREQALAVARSENPEEFLGNLMAAWEAHNDLAVEIDRFLCRVGQKEFSLQASTVLEEAVDLLRRAFRVEDTKRVYSAAVKPALDRFVEAATERYVLSPKELHALLTPWAPSFWVFYWGEHVSYLLAERIGFPEASQLRTKLCETFHAAEEVILSARLGRKGLSELAQASESDLQTEVELYRAACERTQQMRIRGIYLALERRDLKAIQEIVRYDNRDEYLFGYNLYGLPDLFLRKRTVQLLVDRGLIASRPSILLYQIEEITNAMSGLTSKEAKDRSKGNSPTKESRKEPQVFLQTRVTTCGVACMMMALNYFLGLPMSRKEEGRLRHRLKIKGFDLIPAISLARHMVEQGLRVEVVHQDPNKFWNAMRLFDERVFQGQDEAYARARKHGVRPQHRPATLEEIKGVLREGGLVIYGILLWGGVKHALLLYRYDGSFHAIDPLRGKVIYSDENLHRAGDLDTGRWFISVWRDVADSGINS